NEKNLFARDVIEASPLAQEILNARPYAYLDDAPLEERRTRAVQQRRWLDPQTAKDMGKLDQEAIDRVRDEAWPRVENADELHDVLRGRLEGLGPVTVAALAGSFGLNKSDIESGLLKLEAEGFVIRGQFTPGGIETEWSARRLLARIHRYTLNRLRQEIEPVSTADFMRYLLAWQKIAPDHQMEGPESVRAIIEQLEGFEAPAAAWEGELLPSRLAEYDPAWLDALCLSGEVVWARLTPPSSRAISAETGNERTRGAAP